MSTAGVASTPEPEPERRAAGNTGQLPLTDLSDLEKAPAVEASPAAPEMAAPPGLATPAPAPEAPPPLPIPADALSLEETGNTPIRSPRAEPSGVLPPELGPTPAGLELGEPAPALASPSPLDDLGAPPLADPGEPAFFSSGGVPELAAPPELAGALELAMPPALSAPVPAKVRAAPPPAERPMEQPSGPDESGARGARHQLRAILLNALSLVLLLVVTLGLLAIWRGEGRSLSLAHLLTSLGRRPSESGAPLVARDISNGLYETAGGGQVLFVSGTVRSRSSAPLGLVRVKVQILSGDQVVREGEALAGAKPTEEELWNVTSPADGERLRSALAARARKNAVPGTSTEFLVFFEAPPDLSGLSFRVAVEALPAAPHPG